jgi:glycosyltransferase involved in cell wall biosynthesis
VRDIRAHGLKRVPDDALGARRRDDGAVQNIQRADANRMHIRRRHHNALTGRVIKEQDVIFFYLATRERIVMPPPDVHAIRIGALDILNRAVVSSPRAQQIIRHSFETMRPDIAHVSLSFSNLDASLPDLCHDLGIPVVATLHIPYGPPGSFWAGATKVLYWIYSSTLAKYDAVIVFSQSQRAMLGDYDIDLARVRVIPNGVDVTKYAPGSKDYKREVGAQLLISYVGRVDPEKNVNVLLECFEALDLPDDYFLVIVGDGLDLGRLRRKYAFDRRVIFRGFVRDDFERARILRSSDVFVLPSAIEGLSLSMLEGMASGAATIATDVGSDREAVHGAGIVIDLDSLDEQLPLALRLLIDYPEFRHDLGDRARARAVAQYSLDQNLNRLVRLYKELAAVGASDEKDIQVVVVGP